MAEAQQSESVQQQVINSNVEPQPQPQQFSHSPTNHFRMNNGGVNQMQRERSFVRTGGQNMQVTA